jgi:hypothetical protein
MDYLGNPPPDTRGLHFATQALLYKRNIVFFRVREEGFSRRDYIQGVQTLENLNNSPKIKAIGIPGVGDEQIIEALMPFCFVYRSILITTESDLFDYLIACGNC